MVDTQVRGDMNFNYVNNIPQPTDDPEDSQPQLLTNTQSNFSIWNVDHYGFGNNMGGWHNVVHIPQISGNVNPPPTTSPANAGQLFTKTVAGNICLFYEDQAGNVYQLTPNTVPSPSYPIVRSAVSFASPNTINNSYNITSVVRNSAGNYTINFPTISTNFPYVSATSNSYFTSVVATSNNFVQILTFNISGNPFDPSLINVIVTA